MKNYRNFLSHQFLIVEEINNEIISIRKLISAENKNEKLILEQLIILMEKYPGNSSILELVVDFIRLNNDETLLEEIEFEDLTNYVENLVMYFPNDLEVNLEYFYFYFNVMDEEEKAKKFISSWFNSVQAGLIDICGGEILGKPSWY